MPLPFAAPAIFVAAATVFARYAIPMFIGSILVSLGIGYVTYQGTEAVIEVGIDEVNARLGGLPDQLVPTLELIGVFDAFQILISGITTSLSLLGVSAVTRFSFRRPTQLRLPT